MDIVPSDLTAEIVFRAVVDDGKLPVLNRIRGWINGCEGWLRLRRSDLELVIVSLSRDGIVCQGCVSSCYCRIDAPACLGSGTKITIIADDEFDISLVVGEADVIRSRRGFKDGKDDSGSLSRQTVLIYDMDSNRRAAFGIPICNRSKIPVRTGFKD